MWDKLSHTPSTAASCSPRCAQAPLRSHLSAWRHAASSRAARGSQEVGRRRAPPRRHATGGGQEGEGLFDSEIVQRELFQIMNDFAQLSALFPKFGQFDLDGKRIFLEKMDGLAEQLKTFTFRMKLSEDKLGRSILDGLNAQMLNAGTNMDAMYEGLARQTDMMRAAIAVEERIADPEELRAFRAKVAAQMSPVTNLNMSPDIMEDPDVIQGLMDPKAMAALEDVVEDPRRLNNYIDRPYLYKFLSKVLGTGSC